MKKHKVIVDKEPKIGYDAWNKGSVGAYIDANIKIENRKLKGL